MGSRVEYRYANAAHYRYIFTIIRSKLHPDGSFLLSSFEFKPSAYNPHLLFSLGELHTLTHTDTHLDTGIHTHTHTKKSEQPD